MGKSRSLFRSQTSASGAGGFTGGSVSLAAAPGGSTASRAGQFLSTERIPSPDCFRGNFGSGESKHSSAPTWPQHQALHRLVMKRFNLFHLFIVGFFLLFEAQLRWVFAATRGCRTGPAVAPSPSWFWGCRNLFSFELKAGKERIGRAHV